MGATYGSTWADKYPGIHVWYSRCRAYRPSWLGISFSNSPTSARGYIPILKAPGSPPDCECVGECLLIKLAPIWIFTCQPSSYIQALSTKTSPKEAERLQLSIASHHSRASISNPTQSHPNPYPVRFGQQIPKASSDLTALIISALGL